MEDIVKKIISEELYVPIDEVVDSKSIKDDLNADSLDYMSLIFRLEEEFGVEFDDLNAYKGYTVGDIIEAVRSALDGEKAKSDN